MKVAGQEIKILHGSRDLFFKHGIKSITMDEIAKYLNISKKTIYTFYKDKNLLVKLMVKSELENEIEVLKVIRTTSENPIEEMLKIMTHLQQFLRRFNPIIFHDLQKYHIGAWEEFRSFQDKTLIGFVEENLKKGIKLSLYRSKINVKILSRLRMAEVNFGFNPTQFPTSIFNPVEVQTEIFEHFLHGIVTLKGLSIIDMYKSK